MAKRKTIKNNPLDNLALETIGGSASGFEHLLTETSQSSKGVGSKLSTSRASRVSKNKTSSPQPASRKPVPLKKKSPNEGLPKTSTIESGLSTQTPVVHASEKSLDQRVTQLEEDDRIQNIMIGIIVAPLALLALLGAAPPL